MSSRGNLSALHDWIGSPVLSTSSLSLSTLPSRQLPQSYRPSDQGECPSSRGRRMSVTYPPLPFPLSLPYLSFSSLHLNQEKHHPQPAPQPAHLPRDTHMST